MGFLCLESFSSRIALSCCVSSINFSGSCSFAACSASSRHRSGCSFIGSAFWVRIGPRCSQIPTVENSSFLLAVPSRSQPRDLLLHALCCVCRSTPGSHSLVKRDCLLDYKPCTCLNFLECLITQCREAIRVRLIQAAIPSR